MTQPLNLTQALPELTQVLNDHFTGKTTQNNEAASSPGHALLKNAILYDDPSLLQQAIKLGIDLETNPDGQGTPIMGFIRNGNLEAVKLLLSFGVKVPDYDLDGDREATIFHAIQKNNLPLAKLLHQHGVSVDLVQTQSTNPTDDQNNDHVILQMMMAHTRHYAGHRPNLFVCQWLETFGWPKKTTHAFWHRGKAAKEILQRVVNNFKQESSRDDEVAQRLFNLILQEYQIPTPPTLQQMQSLEKAIQRDLEKSPYGDEYSEYFYFSDFLEEAIQEDEYLLLDFLVRSNWLHDFRVNVDDRFVSPIWAAATRTNQSMWGTLLRAPSVVERARMDYREDPSTFFPLLRRLSLHELNNIKKLKLDFAATDKEGNTFFHYISSKSELKKGHLNFSVEVGADVAFSIKNKKGFTPFDIRNQYNYDMSSLQSYFEQNILPKTLRKTLRDLPKPIPAQTRKRI